MNFKQAAQKSGYILSIQAHQYKAITKKKIAVDMNPFWYATTALQFN
jgi:hypothetical protein